MHGGIYEPVPVARQLQTSLLDKPPEGLPAQPANLSAVFERTEHYRELPEGRWREIALLALMNPNLHSKFIDQWVRIRAAITKDFYTAEEVRRWYEREGWVFLIHVYTNKSLYLRSNPAVVAEARSLRGDLTIEALKRLTQEMEQLRQLLFRLRGRITLTIVCIVVIGFMIVIR